MDRLKLIEDFNKRDYTDMILDYYGRRCEELDIKPLSTRLFLKLFFNSWLTFPVSKGILDNVIKGYLIEYNILVLQEKDGSILKYY